MEAALNFECISWKWVLLEKQPENIVDTYIQWDGIATSMSKFLKFLFNQVDSTQMATDEINLYEN